MRIIGGISRMQKHLAQISYIEAHDIGPPKLI